MRDALHQPRETTSSDGLSISSFEVTSRLLACSFRHTPSHSSSALSFTNPSVALVRAQISLDRAPS